MAPGSAKRKRPDRQFSQDDGPGRPSPHRPESLGMAQREQHGGRGGRGGAVRRQSRQGGPEGANAVPVTPRNAPPPLTPQSQPLQRVGTPAGEISRTSTPVQRTATPVQQPPAQPEQPQLPPILFAYDYVTDDAVASWQERGRQDVLDTSNEADEVVLSTIMQELIRSCMDGRLDPTEAGSAVRQIIAGRHQEGNLDLPTLFLSTLSMLEEAETTNNPKVAALLAATNIDPDVIRQDLDVPLLISSRLVQGSFSTIRNRKATNILYRQANFNLLREESEGYAKLITEYYNTAAQAGPSRESGRSMAENAFQRVMALVGSFDLDVGRVLDITFDISANALVRAYGFFMTFYRCSSWWPDEGLLDNVKVEDQGFSNFPTWALPNSMRTISDDEEDSRLTPLKRTRDEKFWTRVREIGVDAFFELGARKIADFDSVAELLATDVEPQLDTKGKEVNTKRRERINENRKFMRETRTLPPPGNFDAAQLLGFKLSFYASEAREAEDTIPENLLHLTALLIKIGFISLRDLYPHLYPADDQMPEEKKRLEKEKAEKEAKERPGGGMNALARASALPDGDAAPPSQQSRNDKNQSGGATPKPNIKDDVATEELPMPANQKIILLKALLLVGAIPEALYILGRFQWLVEADVTLAPYLLRIVRHMLSKMTDELRPLRDRAGLGDQVADATAQADGTLKFSPRPPRRPIKWLGLDEISENDGSEFRHYYSDWTDNVPVCQNVDDVFLLVDTFMGYLGVKIGRDTEILGTLVRLAKKSLTEDTSEPNRKKWLDLMRRLLVPALSLSKHNPGLSTEVYELLMFFPITARYNIYAEWYTGKTSRLPDMKIAFDYNRAEVREVLRRVSNENVRKQRNALAKVSHSSPGVLIMYMINQLESYSNMIPPLVECVKHLSPLCLDVLIWYLIKSLSGEGRDRMQADGMLTSPWLQALSQFVASLFSHYSSKLNPSPVLQYLASELRSGNTTDLEMFEQVLAEMAGIRSDMEYNDAQVLAMAGGEHLQAQTLLQLADARNTRKSTAKRLIKALAEPGLIGQTLISIAQERQMYPHHESSKDMPLKVLGNNLDKIQQVFAQYLDVLRTNLTPAEFEAAVPDVIDLIGQFGLEPGIAFTICRSAIAARVVEVDEAKKQEELEERKRRLSESRAQSSGEIEMKDVPVNGVASASLPEIKVESGAPNGETPDIKPSATPQPPTSSGGDNAEWHPVLLPIIQGLKDLRPGLAARVSPSFFVTFWTLSQSDVVVLTDSYHAELDRLKSQVNEINRDRTDNTSVGARERDRKKKALQEMQDNLRAEVKGRVAYYTRVSNRLSHKEKNHWFDRSRAHEDVDNKHRALLQECFLPRAMLSSLDAHYSFLMLKLLHDKGTPGFSIVHLVAQLFGKQELAAIIFQCTALEAQHFGRFLHETLRLLASWHADVAVYEKEALGKQKLHSFALKLDANGNPETFIPYENFRRQMYNWHSALNGALQMCFESGEYMHIRNGIMVLKAIHQTFPALNFHGKNMVTQVTRLSKEDSRQDLKLMAMSLLGPLSTREKSWVLPQAFRLNDPAKEGKSNSRAPSARPETPQPSTVTPKLDATAPEFKPELRGANDLARNGSLAGIEDGEVEEEKQTLKKEGDADTKGAPALSAIENRTVRASQPAEIVSAMETPKPESRAATPATAAARDQRPVNVTGRHESERPRSTQPGTPRGPQELPQRAEPKAPLPRKPLPTPPVERPSGRFPGRADDRYGRLERPNDVRPGSRDQSPNHRGRARTPPLPSRPIPREDGPPQRFARDDSLTGARRDTASPSLHSRPTPNARDRPNGAMAPPPPTQATQSDRGGFLSSAVAASPSQASAAPTPSTTLAAQSSSDDPFTNPARRAMMNGGVGRDAQPAEKDRRQDGAGRDDRATTDHAQRPDARPNGRGPHGDPPREPHGRREQPADLAPSGPRHGRLNRDSREMNAPAEPTYGRLNAPQEAPSGPRAPNGPPPARGGRNFGGPPQPLNTRGGDAALASPSAARPSEPSMSLRDAPRQPGDRRGSGAHMERQQSTSVPTTPAAENGPMHPSRMAQFTQQPPPIQTSVQPVNVARNASSPTSAPPTGPRGPGGRAPAGAPTGPSPITNGAPAGPASSVERLRRDRQRASINSITQGSTAAPGPRGNEHSFRGAAANSNRQGSLSMPSAAAVPPVQALASPMEPPALRRNEPPPRHDGPSSRPDSQAEPRSDLFQKRDETEARSDGRGRRHEDERSERHRSSRNPSRERRPDDEPPRRPPPPGMEEGRDQRGTPRDERRLRDERDSRDGPPRDQRGSARPGRGDDGQRQPPDMPGSFAAPPPGYERGDLRGQPRHGPDESRRGGRGSGRGEDFRGQRREDDRNGGRGPARDDMPPDGRKRRHEEGPFDQSKRRRSGR